MENGYFVFFILLFVIIVFYFGYYWQNNNLKENWGNYITGPFNEIRSGSTPFYFYNRPQYRLPYRYPYTFYSTDLLPQVTNYNNL